MIHDTYPTIHALGLGPALDEIERVFAIGAAGKYAGQQLEPNPQVHIDHALDHMTVGAADHQARDQDTGERELAHVGARILAALRTSGGGQ